MTFKGMFLSIICAASFMLGTFGISESALASTVHVEGVATFEQHYTVAPRIIIEGQPPIEPSPYWVMVIKSADGNIYSLDTQFDLGDATKPAAITFLGKTIQDNNEISVDGTISYQLGNSIWLTDVTNIDPVRNFTQQVILPPQQTDPLMNWTCQGQMDSANEVYVDVWFQASAQPTPSNPGSYIVHLSSASLQGDDRQFSELAYLESGHIQVQASSTVFNASTAEDSVTLQIANSDAVEQVPGVLTFSIQESSRDLGISSVESFTNLQMTCNRNR